MKFAKNKTKATIIALFLFLTTIIPLSTLQTVNAAVNYYHPYLFAYPSPQLVGLGQTTLLVYWTDLVPPDIGEQSGAVASPSGRAGWDGVKVVVTKPDGTNETFSLPRSDPVGGGYYPYVPEQTGPYAFQTFFPAVWKNTTSTQAFYSSAVGKSVSFTVQEEQLSTWQGVALPTDYWSRPIYAMNRDWYNLAGNWLGGISGGYSYYFNNYTTAPETAHIVWSKPIYFGGIAEGKYGDIPYYEGLSYEYYWTPPVIIAGRLYYNERTPPRYGWYCVDLYTGKDIWFHNSTGPLETGQFATPRYPPLAFGQIYNYESPNQKGALAYLWSMSGSTWQMYDAFTGNWILNIKNVPSGRTDYGPDGSILIYTYNSTAGWFSLWNSSRVLGLLAGTSGTNYWQWRPPPGATLDGSTGYSWNVTAPVGLGSISTASYREVTNDKILGSRTVSGTLTVWALSTKPGQEGTLLWTKDYPPPITNGTQILGPMGEGVYTIALKQTNQWYGFSLETGEKLWGPTEQGPSLDMYSTATGDGLIANGRFYTAGYAGVLFSYDVQTGKLLWNYTTEDSHFETPYGNYPLVLGAIADGKIYLVNSEHSPTKPAWRGAQLRCVDVNTGKELWKILNWGNSQPGYTGLFGGTVAIADGYLLALDGYNNQLYCYSKGLSATSIAASPKVSLYGSSVLIEGEVTDQSPGQTCLGIPAAGTPAISDDDMSAWMEYLYKQQPKPTDVTGVKVVINVLDSNGNYRSIGDTTSNSDGFYSLSWKPDIPGKYTVTATFEGSKSYWPSHAMTAFTVDEAEPTASPNPVTAQPPTEMYILAGVAAIIVAIAIGFAVTILVLRKRP